MQLANVAQLKLTDDICSMSDEMDACKFSSLEGHRRWSEHFKDHGMSVEEPTHEITKTIKSLKTPGPDVILPSLFKDDGEAVSQERTEFLHGVDY